MKLSVGYSLIAPDRFNEAVVKFRSSISEIYFAWPDMPSGRSAGPMDSHTRSQLISDLLYDLEHYHAMSIPLVLLFNGNCHGNESMSTKLVQRIKNIIGSLQDGGIPIAAVTTASPFIAFHVKRLFPDIQIRASVNMRISHFTGMEYLADRFDFFYVAKEMNRDLDKLSKLKEAADGLGKNIGILANSGCLNHCSNQIFHDNLVSHEAQLVDVDTNYSPVQCRNLMANQENWLKLLTLGNWIRPEDLRYYENVVSSVKLATRMHANPYMVIASYAEGRHRGNLLDLTEPSFAQMVAPNILDSSEFPEGWSTHTHSTHEALSLMDKAWKRVGR
jgi:collagenase-like PrtC family protease